MLASRIRIVLPFALLTAVLAVSTSSVFVRFAQTDAPSLVIATSYRVSRSRKSPLGCIARIFLAVHFATWISSLEYTSVASSVVFVSTGPLWVALLSPFLLNEKLTHATVVGLVIAVLGGIVIGISNACTWEGEVRCQQLTQFMQGRALWVNFLALVGAWIVSGYLIIGRKLRSKLSLIPCIFLVCGLCAVALIMMMFAAGQSPFGYPAQTYGWIFLLAAFPQLIGHSTYN